MAFVILVIAVVAPTTRQTKQLFDLKPEFGEVERWRALGDWDDGRRSRELPLGPLGRPRAAGFAKAAINGAAHEGGASSLAEFAG